MARKNKNLSVTGGWKIPQQEREELLDEQNVNVDKDDTEDKE